MNRLEQFHPLYTVPSHTSNVMYVGELPDDNALPAVGHELSELIGSAATVTSRTKNDAQYLIIGTGDNPAEAKRTLALIRQEVPHRYTHRGSTSIRTMTDLTGEHAATHIRITINDEEGALETVPSVDTDTLSEIAGITKTIVVPRLAINPNAFGSAKHRGYIFAALDKEWGKPDAQLPDRGLRIAKLIAERTGVMLTYLADRETPPKIMDDGQLPIVGAYGHHA